MLTLFGLVLNGVVALLLATGHLVAGGVVMILAGLFDLLDGALAKITNRVSDFGAFLDSVVDRYSEALVLLGLLLYYYGRPATDQSGLINHYFLPTDPRVVSIILIYATLFGSMMISYARARAGALKIRNEVGILARPERIVLLAVGLLFQTVLLEPVLWVLAIGTQITSIQRIVHVWQVTTGKKQG
jgi:CDP-diacylglycerol--glycerol-3-phosphate 3-phosphatidyltransferase